MTFLDFIAAQLNASIAASARAAECASAVEGARLAVQVEGLNVRVLVVVQARRLRLALDSDADADVELCGTPIDLLRLLGPDSLRELRGSRVELRGDLKLAEAFADLLKAAEPDFEEALSGWTGDIAAHAIGQGVRGLVAFGVRATRAIELDTVEFLQEESGLLPGARQVRALCDAIDRLRDDVERAAERLERLSDALAIRG